MGTLYLVRHGQASFGADDYDRLSPLGERQCEALGVWFAEHGIDFEAVLCGTLRRHVESLAAIGRGRPGLPPALPWAGMNEYDSDALLAAIGHVAVAAPAAGAADAAAAARERHRAHFRALRTALQGWAGGSLAPAGMPSHADWKGGIVGALDHVRTNHTGNVLMVSSGGPIATAVGHVLGTDVATAIELNLRMRNSSVTEFVFTPHRHVLLSFNHLPHLGTLERAGWISYA